jgi:oligopeptide/dipeptide ABC transporter ATP-binding protein
MCQRVMIAIATALDPEILIADEPTSALDVTVQAGILRELQRLRERNGTSILLITHDFGVVAQVADRVAVMYAGSVVEEGDVATVLGKPRHPYTHALLSTLPRLDNPREVLPSIKGAPPALEGSPEHCSFLPRCIKAVTACRTEDVPPLTNVNGSSQRVACYNPVYHFED